jgi:DNA modification methylase
MTPHYIDDSVTVHHGDCLDVLRELPDASVDAVVTDPPYALEFMGSTWDGWSSPKAFQEWCELWAAECLRVLKPGGHLLAFGGSRTWHRLAAAVEDAGFEIRDSIAWLYGSGFPKSLDVAKAIDQKRDDRADILRVTGWLAEQRDRAGWTNQQIDEAFGFNGMALHWTSAPHRKVAQVPRWEQWTRLRELLGFGDEMDAEVSRLNGRKGTPGETWQTAEVLRTETRAHAPSGLVGIGQECRKTHGTREIKAPNSSAAEQWQGWGTALKPAFEPIVVGRKPLAGTVAANVLAHGTGALNIGASRGETGRWPANVVLDDSQAAGLDRQTGTLTSGSRKAGDYGLMGYMGADAAPMPAIEGDTGGASRFFPTFRYEAKAPTAERPRVGDVAHPTVKPLDLMRWLVRLVTPPGGVVLEPFAGSGTTAEACVLEGFRCIAIEREADYLPLIVGRLSKPVQLALDFGPQAAAGGA